MSLELIPGSFLFKYMIKFLFTIFVFLAVVGCIRHPQPPPKNSFTLIDKAETFNEKETVYWKTGNDQTVILLNDDDLKDWLDKAADKEIISIAPLTYGKSFSFSNIHETAYGQTSSFLIVYKQLRKSEFENGNH